MMMNITIYMASDMMLELCAKGQQLQETIYIGVINRVCFVLSIFTFADDD